MKPSKMTVLPGLFLSASAFHHDGVAAVPSNFPEIACKHCTRLFVPGFCLQVICQACRTTAWQAWQKRRRRKNGS